MGTNPLPDGVWHLVFASVVAFLGLYHLALYRTRRELSDHLWLGPLGLSAAGYILFHSPLTLFGKALYQKQVETIFLFLTAISFFQFLMSTLPARIIKALRVYQVAQVILIFVAAFSPALAASPQLLFWWQLISLPFAVLAFTVVVRKASVGNPDAQIVAGGLAVLFLTYVSDLAAYWRWVETLDLFPFGVAVQVICFSLSRFSRLPRLYREFEALRNNLERKVKEQTQELSERTRQMVEANAQLNEKTKALTLANQKLTVRSNDLVEANLSKSRFLANMSHELRTPLNAIIGYSEMILEEAEEDGERPHPDLGKISIAGKHLLSIISEILDLSKIEAGKMELSLETFDLSELVNDVVSTIDPLMEKNTNAFEVRKIDPLGQMHADPTKVRQILLNLLSNSAKFTHNGLVQFEVKRDRVFGMDTALFTVTDSGIGISEDQMNRLFQAFSQADVSTTKKYGGTGLGLVISKKYCEMMGGDIRVKSEFGVGSTFNVRLPIMVHDPHELSTTQPQSLPS